MIFCTDLDNTLIYSYRRAMPDEKRCVEWYEGREVSFLSEKTYEGLRKIEEKMLIVPVTTRTEEQYQRINLGIRPFAYALVCNGGVLLRDGKEEKSWYYQSLELVKEALDELNKAEQVLEQDIRRSFEIRNIRNLFLFTKSNDATGTINDLKKRLNLSKVDVFSNGVKVYVVPKQLNKGMAIQRFKKYIGNRKIIAAGDSLFDIPMLEEAEVGLAPRGLLDEEADNKGIQILDKEELFSEQIVEILEEIGINCG